MSDKNNRHKVILAIIFHRRMVVTRGITNSIHYNKSCIECSFKKKGGVIYPKQDMILYHVRDDVSYVSIKKTTVQF